MCVVPTLETDFKLSSKRSLIELLCHLSETKWCWPLWTFCDYLYLYPSTGTQLSIQCVTGMFFGCGRHCFMFKLS